MNLSNSNKDYNHQSMDEIVFENRNKDYGAFELRKSYRKTIKKAIIWSSVIFIIALLIPSILRFFGGAEIDPLDDYTTINMNEVLFQDMKVPEVQQQEKSAPTGNIELIPDKVETGKTEVVDDKSKLKGDTSTGKVAKSENGSGAGTNGKTDTTEILAKFNGKLTDYIDGNLDVPDAVVNFKLKGDIYVSFVIEVDGSVTNVIIDKQKSVKLGYGCEEAALRVIKNMPKWIPGKKGGIKTRQFLKIPVNFGS